MDISIQARTALAFFYQHPDIRINHRTMMEHLELSRRKSYAVLKELCDANFMRIIKQVGGGTNIRLVASDTTEMVVSGIAVDAVQLLQLISNSSNARTAVAKNKFFDEVEENEKKKEDEVGYDFFEASSSPDDDMLRERDKHMAQKKVEYAEARLRKAERSWANHRSNIDPVQWSCKDVAYEFADRMSNIWTIAPFSVTQSRFVQALSGFRKQHDTNGALELAIIELFFTSLSAEKYTDGNHLWRAFMYKAPMLLQTARETTTTTEERETDIIKDAELTAKKLSLFDEDDDV